MVSTKQEPSPIGRRAMLTGMIALPFAAPAATLAMAASSGPAPAPDPIFAALDAHAVALKDYAAASERYVDAEEALLAREGHFLPTISTEFPRSREIHQPWQIDQLVRHLYSDEETRQRVGAELKQQLVESERRIQWIKIDLGWDEIEARRNAANDRESEALAALIETVPTTLAGCLALLNRLLSRDVFLDGAGDSEDEIEALETLRLALRRIEGGHVNA